MLKAKMMVFAANAEKLAMEGVEIDAIDTELIEHMNVLDDMLMRLGKLGVSAYFAIRRDFENDSLRLSQALTVTTDQDDLDKDRDKLVWMSTLRYASENHDNPMLKLVVLTSVHEEQRRETCATCAKKDTCQSEDKCG